MEEINIIKELAGGEESETYMYIPVEEYKRLVQMETLLDVIMASQSKEGFVNTEVIKAVQKILEIKETNGGQKC